MKALEKKLIRTLALFLTLLPVLPAAEPVVASLHPLLTDLVREVGGDKIVVVELIGADDNPHEFDPSPQTLRKATHASMVLASGKGLESSYLSELQDGLQPGQEIFEVGRGVHSLVASDGNLASACAHHHHSGVIDPHWWHDPANMSQAAEILAEKFAEIDPANASFFEANARNYQEQLEALDGWIRMQIEEIPPSKRILATSHLAFGYLCRRYGLTAVGVQGLNREDSPPPQKLAEIITYLRSNDVPALFPEVGSNPKALQTVAVEAGIPLGNALYPDGSGLPPGDGYLDMMRANVTAITEGLTGSPQRVQGR